jgi:DNA-binding MarR family transcriptional regulator
MAPPPPNVDESIAARVEALRQALKEVLDRSVECTADLENNRPRGAPLEQRRLAEHDLIDEITISAQLIAAARDGNGEPIYRTDRAWRVLATVARSPYCLAIADIARALGVRKQTAHALAHAAARAGVIELAPNPHDKRILQALLTPRGRAALAAARSAETSRLATLLNGLGDHELKATMHVVRVVRQRLERDARALERRQGERARRKRARRERARRERERGDAEQAPGGIEWARRNALLSE